MFAVCVSSSEYGHPHNPSASGPEPCSKISVKLGMNTLNVKTHGQRKDGIPNLNLYLSASVPVATLFLEYLTLK